MIRSLLATELRWDFERIDQTPWPDIVKLLNYWHKTPPLNRLLFLYFKARGLTIISSTEPTDAERRFVDSAKKADISQLPAHLKEMMQDVQTGKLKYARNSG